MGTRITPGRFDCAAAALDDEPTFMLLARDEMAGFLVSIWSSIRYGDWEAAQTKFLRMLESCTERFVLDPDVDKASEALDCAMAMFAWRRANDGRWREPRPAAEPSELVKTLGAAVMALRSYQCGNGATDLAKELADAGEQALERAGYPLGFKVAGGVTDAPAQ